MNKRLVLIFAKQARKGKVKTRLVKTIGDEKALEIYLELLQHTAKEIAEVKADRWVCYSPEIEENDAFSDSIFEKKQQTQGDLGERMLTAFKDGFKAGYQSIVLVGSDIYELQTTIIEAAFEVLESKEVVFGPAKDGGYYLVGLRQAIPSIFLNKKWSHAEVLAEALKELEKGNYSYKLVDQLNDIDYEKDLPLELREKFEI
jgi:rSAM/selenodomain-associated transferase 1